jgi:hypothetical protein
MKMLALRFATPIILLVSFLAVGCNRNQSHPKDVDFSLLRQKVIEQVTNGTIKEDSTGKLTLPENLKAASVGGDAFVSRNQPGGLMIVFSNSAATSDSKEHGILYSTGNVSMASPVIVAGMQWHVDTFVEGHFWTVTKI